MQRMRITVQNRKEVTSGKFGIDSKGIEWENTVRLWAWIDFAKGKRAMNQGALDAYALILVRMDWSPQINMRSRIEWNGKYYQILPETFHDDYQENRIQFNAQLIVNES